MSEAYAFSLVCDEFDQFNELANGWDTEFKPLSASPSESIQLVQSYTGITQMSFAHFDLAVNQKAQAPQGMRNIAILPLGHPDLMWCGKHITGGQVLLFDESGEMESISKEGFEVFSLSVPKPWIQQFSSTNSTKKIGPEEQVLQSDNIKIQHFYHKLSALMTTLKSDILIDEAYQTLQDATLFEGLSTLFESSSHYPFSLAKEQRMKVLGNALDFIHNKGQRVRISEICYHTGTSERTLERLFNNMLGLSPKKYLNRFLLQKARHLFLNETSEHITVKDIAHHLGFTHMGQFSAAYQGLFNELPSDTLKRR